MLKLFFRNTKMIHARRIEAFAIIVSAISIVLIMGLSFLRPFPQNLFLSVIYILFCIVLSIGILLYCVGAICNLNRVANKLRTLKYDRDFFVPSGEPKKRSEWEHTVSEHLLGTKLKEWKNSRLSKHVPVFAGVGKNFSVRCDSLECFFLYYSIDSLDRTAYDSIWQDAKNRIRSYPARRKRVFKHSRLKIRYGTAAAVVILADSVSEAILPLCKETYNIRDGVLFPAVVDCTKNRVYMDGKSYSPQCMTAPPHFRGMLPVTQADSQKLIGRIVFGTSGKIPVREGAHTEEYRAFYRKCEVQTYGKFREKKNVASSTKIARELFKEMKNNEFRFAEDTLYLAVDGKMMSIIFEVENNSAEPISIPASRHGRVLLYDPDDLGWELPTLAEMTAAEKEVYLPRMIAYMKSVGYTVKVNADAEV